MIISAVADPRIFGTQVVTDEFAKREVLHFLRAVVESGVLIDDPDQTLLRESIRNVQTLRTDLGQRLSLLLQEILTKAKKFVISSGIRINLDVYQMSPGRELIRLATAMRVDAVVVSKSHATQLVTPNEKQVAFGVVHVQDWSEHKLEAHRKALLTPDRPLDELQPSERDERVGRALKYASSIKVFDALLVASEQRASKYRDGIGYFVSVWERWTVQASEKLLVEVYTVGDKQTPSGFLTGREAESRLRRFILEPLQNSARCIAKGIIKKDREPPLFHARLIHVRMRVYSIDPGFDGFGLNGPVRRCFFHLESAGLRHVEDCLKLQDAN